MRKRALGLAFGSLMTAAMLISGCSSNVPSVPEAVTGQPQSLAFASASPAVPTEAAQAVQEVPSPSVAVAVSPAAVTCQDAITAVQQQLPDSTPVSCSLDMVNQQLVWDIEVLAADGTAYETAVNASTGSLVYARPDDDRPDVTAGEFAVDYTQAIAIAQALYPDCYLESFSVERESGTVVYEVEMRNAQGRDLESIIDAHTGEVLDYTGAAQLQTAQPAILFEYGDGDLGGEAPSGYSIAPQPAAGAQTAAPAAAGAQHAYRHHEEHHG